MVRSNAKPSCVPLWNVLMVSLLPMWRASVAKNVSVSTPTHKHLLLLPPCTHPLLAAKVAFFFPHTPTYVHTHIEAKDTIAELFISRPHRVAWQLTTSPRCLATCSLCLQRCPPVHIHIQINYSQAGNKVQPSGVYANGNLNLNLLA